MFCIAQYYSESRVWLEFRVCKTPLFFQIEELKNDNALLRAQLQQHGIEVNGDATPQWRLTRTRATSQTRRRILPPTHTEQETISNSNWTTSENGETRGWRRTLTDWNGGRGGGDTLRSVNRVANWTSHLRFRGKKNDLCTAATWSTKRSFYVNLWTCRQQFTFNCHLSHRTSNASLFLLLFSNFFLDICCVRNY